MGRGTALGAIAALAVVAHCGRVEAPSSIVYADAGEDVRRAPPIVTSPVNVPPPPPPEPPPVGGPCIDLIANLSRAAARIVLVVDGSAASADGGAATSLEWAAMRGAIADFVSGAMSDGGSPLAVGLVAFGDALDSAAGYPSPLDVPIKIVDDAQRAAFAARLAGSPAPSSANATAALAGAYASLASQPNAWNPSVILLSRSGRGTLTTNARQASWDVVASARAGATSPPVRTFAIGVGAGTDAFLHGIAERGETCDAAVPAPAPNPCHRAVDPTGKSEATLRAEVFVALSAVAQRAAACVFQPVPRAPDAGVLPFESLNLVAQDKNGDPSLVPIDDVDGWSWWPLPSNRMPEAVLLHGQSCNDDEPFASAALVAGCPTGAGR